MKRICFFIGILTLTFAGMASAVTVSLQTIQTTNFSGCGVGCLQIGDKQFTSLGITGHNTSTEGAWTEANIDVDGVIDPDGTVNILFNLPATAGNGLSNLSDFNLAYTVTVIGNQLIDSIDQHIAGVAGLNNGFVQVSEHVSNLAGTTELANSVVTIPGDPNDPDGEANDVLKLTVPSSAVKVVKDVQITAGSLAGISGQSSLTQIRQSFHQIPEPAQSALMLFGCLAIGLYYKSRNRAQA